MNSSMAAALLQIAALTWVGMATLDIMRKQTLAKNLPWVLGNPAFLQRTHRPEYRLLLVLAGLSSALVGVSPWVFPSGNMVHIKSVMILVGCGVLCVFHGWQEKKIAQEIPKPEQRTASLKPRTTAAYVPPTLRRWVDGAALALGIAYGGAYAAGFLADSFALACAFSGILTAAAMGWGRWAVLTEKSPHFQQVRIISDKDLSENYRRFSLQLFLVLQLFVIVLFAAFLGAYLVGYQLVQNPLQEWLQKWLGEAGGLPVLVSYAHYDVFASLITTPLLIYIPLSSAFWEIRKINLLDLQPEAK